MDPSSPPKTCRAHALEYKQNLRYTEPASKPTKSTLKDNAHLNIRHNNDALPKDLLVRILSFLGRDADYCACDSVCKTWRDANTSEALWKVRISRFFAGKHLVYHLRALPRDRKSTYIYAKKDAKRNTPIDDREVTECEWSLRFLESMGMFWVAFNPPPGSNSHLRRQFLPSGDYWYPPGDAVFADPMISAMMPRQMKWITFRQDSELYMQLEDFPAMHVYRDPVTWGWIIGGFRTEYRSIGLVREFGN